MKIIIASTPKTGNTWITHLLSTIYDLQEVQLPRTFDATAANQRGSNWISLRHYYPDPHLLAWAKRRQGLVVTTVRHPGDVLVSMRHMIRNESYDPNVELRRLTMLVADGDHIGAQATRYVKDSFFFGLYISLMWMKSGESLVVRYEDLWRDPIATISELTNKIRPVPPKRIESAVDLCDIGMLRKLYNDPEGKFFRKGGPGNWRHELPDSIVDVFRHQEPYPSLFRALGYTLDPYDPLIDSPAKPRVSTNPFLENSEFADGTKVSTVVVKLYLMLEPMLKARWSGNETATSDDSFFAWLNAPADQDPQRQDHVPIITNLAHYIYRSRRDIQQAFPDLFGKDREAYVIWFLRNAQAEYDLGQVFVKPMRDSLRATRPDMADERILARAKKVAQTAKRSRVGVRTSHHRGIGTGSDPTWSTPLEQIEAIAQVNPHLPIAWPTWPNGLLPKVRAFVQKVIRRLLRWYIDPIVEQQNRFNAAVVQALDALWQEISNSQKELPQEEQKSELEDD